MVVNLSSCASHSSFAV